jgi:hypothetical protein
MTNRVKDLTESPQSHDHRRPPGGRSIPKQAGKHLPVDAPQAGRSRTQRRLVILGGGLAAVLAGTVALGIATSGESAVDPPPSKAAISGESAQLTALQPTGAYQVLGWWLTPNGPPNRGH